MPLAGSRKVATVLVADVKGSLTAIADRDPEVAAEFLAQTVHLLAGIVRREGGTVSERLGDGIVAVFGVPVATEDHAVRACSAALKMRDAKLLGGVLPRLPAEEVPDIELRIGLHSGEVVLRGADEGLADHVIGSGTTVHIAARMEQTTTPGRIRATAATLRLTAGLVDAAPVGLVPIKGLAQPLEVWEVLAVRRRVARHDAQTWASSVFVGREAQLQRLRAARAQALESGGRAILVVGEAGTGKSRLLSEFLAEPDFAAWRILQAQALPIVNTGYSVVTDLLAALLGLGEAATASAAGAVDHCLTELGLRSEHRAPLLALLDPMSTTDSEWTELPAIERGRRIAAAVRAVLSETAMRMPLVIRVEDLQWLDGDSARILRALAQSAHLHRLLVLATCRIDGSMQQDEPALPSAEELRIAPLERHHAEELLRRTLRFGGPSAEIDTLVLDRAQGNPFFLEEILSSLADRGVLVRLRDGYARAGHLTPPEVPSTIRALLAARIDSLGLDERYVLRAAAVVGREVPRWLLGLVAKVSPERLRRAVERLVRDGFLTAPQIPGPAGLLAFRHALTHEVAYAETLLSERRLLHARAVGAIEAARRRSRGDWTGTLAEHAFRAEQWDKAVGYAREAAAQAAARDSNKEAAKFFEQAIAALERLPDTADTHAEAIDIRLDLRTSLHRLGRIDDIAARLAEVEVATAALQDPLREARLRIFQGHVRWLLGDFDGASRITTLGRELARQAGDPALEGLSRFHQGMVLLFHGRYADCVAEMRAALETIPPRSANRSLRRAWEDMALDVTSYTARAHAELGEWEAAYAAADEAARLAARARGPFAQIFSGVAAGMVRHLDGRPEQAIPFLERALLACRESDARLMTPVAGTYLGAAQLAIGRHDVAQQTLAFAVREAEDMHFVAFHPLRLAFLAEAQVQCGAPPEGCATARRAVALALEVGERGSAAYALFALGRAEGQLGGAPGETPHLLQALHLARELGMRPLAARCLVELRKAPHLGMADLG